MSHRTSLVTIALSVLVTGSAAQAATVIVSSDTAAVAAFQSGATVLGFDELTPNSVGGSLQGNTGAEIQSASQLSAQYAAKGITFSSDGGPLGVVSVEGLSNVADAKSPFNVIGGSITSAGKAVLNYFATITLTFASLTSKVGAWNDPTGSNITLTAYDAADNILATATGDQGKFLGIVADDIAKATFTYNFTQGAAGFSLDDVTFVAIPAEPSEVPLPATAFLALSGLAALAGLGQAKRRRA